MSIVEAEALFGSIEILNGQAIGVTANDINIDTMGGAIKVGEIITRVNRKTSSSKLITILQDYIKTHFSKRKFNFGLSYYGDRLHSQQLGMQLKQSLKKDDLNPRLVVADGSSLNAASIINNHLIDKGIELLLINTPTDIVIARTTAVQDINSYSKRDYHKPCRDNQVGMLPPKLSQILINLCSPSLEGIIIDPFCGSGGLLMEAGLMGYRAEGSDINPKMTECAKLNTQWLQQNYHSSPITILPSCDATKRNYDHLEYYIATEGFLGENFTTQPTTQQVLNQKPILERLYIDFFTNLRQQKSQPSAISMCAPYWILNHQEVTLDIIDEIGKLGYNYSEFKSVRSQVLRYYRPGQNTGRQILLFSSK